MISGVPHDTPENPHDFAIRPGSPAGPEGPSPSARQNGPAWASRARSASKWWVQPPNRTSAQPASHGGAPSGHGRHGRGLQMLPCDICRDVISTDFQNINYPHTRHTTIFSGILYLSLFFWGAWGCYMLKLPRQWVSLSESLRLDWSPASSHPWCIPRCAQSAGRNHEMAVTKSRLRT